jgi:hypothetical protein
MKSRKSLYHRHRFSSEIIRHAVWLYYLFCLSDRDVEDLLAERGIYVGIGYLGADTTQFESGNPLLSSAAQATMSGTSATHH